MKKITFLILIVVLLATLSCKKVIIGKTANTEVENYIELLSKNEYTSLELPEFTHEDIPALLKYRNETQRLTTFPRNLISSFGQSECSLGMHVLWTIESIRAVAVDSELLTTRFPSLNPTVNRKDSEFRIEQGNEIQSIISEAYFDWWEENENKDFEDFKDIDPLLETDYYWN